MKSIHPKRGVTLLEVAIALAIFTILGGAVMVGLHQTNRRTLENASLQLQADIRYAQRRTTTEGRPYGIIFEPAIGRYRIVYFLGTPDQNSTNTRIVRTVYLPPGVRLFATSHPRLWFHPRGTPSGGFRVELRQGNNVQNTTVSVSGGRAYIWPVNQIPDVY